MGLKQNNYRNISGYSGRLNCNFDNSSVQVNAANVTDVILEISNFLVLTKTITIRSNASQNRNKEWFDRDCRIQKKCVLMAYNNLKKNNFDSDSLQNYHTNKKAYKSLIKDKKHHYNLQIKNNLKQINCPRTFWQTIAKMQKHKNISLKDEIPVTVWESFYARFYGTRSLSTRYLFLTDRTDDYLDKEITMQELYMALNFCKNKKAAGPDGTTIEFYKNLNRDWFHYIFRLFKQILALGEVPATWFDIKMFHIHKKGDTDNPENYRSIALINQIAKLLTCVIVIG